MNRSSRVTTVAATLAALAPAATSAGAATDLPAQSRMPAQVAVNICKMDVDIPIEYVGLFGEPRIDGVTEVFDCTYPVDYGYVVSRLKKQNPSNGYFYIMDDNVQGGYYWTSKTATADYVCIAGNWKTEGYAAVRWNGQIDEGSMNSDVLYKDCRI